MGEMANTINYHYSRKNLSVLNDIYNNSTVDEEDRELAKEYIEKLTRARNNDEEER